MLGNFGRTLPTGSVTSWDPERRKKKKKKARHDFRVLSDLLVQGNRESLSGAHQRNRAVLCRAKTSGVVDRRKLGPHAADRL